VVGRQDATVEGVGLWVLPNPSGLNAHWRIDGLAGEFAQLRRAAGPVRRGPHRTGPHGTGPHGTGPHGTGSHGTGGGR
jgi:TDG/mug DNA glycosylase family protein